MNYLKLMRLSIGTLLLSGATMAVAGPMTWELSGVYFDDGTQATGTFTYNADTDTVLSYSITVQNGADQNDPSLQAYTYTANSAGLNTCTNIATGNVNCNNAAANEFSLGTNDGSQSLSLFFASALTNAGGGVSLLNEYDSYDYESYEINNITSEYRGVTGGELLSVPEPASVALMGVALAGLFGARRLRKQRN